MQNLSEWIYFDKVVLSKHEAMTQHKRPQLIMHMQWLEKKAIPKTLRQTLSVQCLLNPERLVRQFRLLFDVRYSSKAKSTNDLVSFILMRNITFTHLLRKKKEREISHSMNILNPLFN